MKKEREKEKKSPEVGEGWSAARGCSSAGNHVPFTPQSPARHPHVTTPPPPARPGPPAPRIPKTSLGDRITTWLDPGGPRGRREAPQGEILEDVGGNGSSAM